MVEAQNNAEQIWKNIFDVASIQDPDAPLVVDYEKDSDDQWIIKDDKPVPIKNSMYDQNCPIAIVLEYIYQQESFVYHEINRAARFNDKSKLLTLGPFAKAFGYVIGRS